MQNELENSIHALTTPALEYLTKLHAEYFKYTTMQQYPDEGSRLAARFSDIHSKVNDSLYNRDHSPAEIEAALNIVNCRQLRCLATEAKERLLEPNHDNAVLFIRRYSPWILSRAISISADFPPDLTTIKSQAMHCISEWEKDQQEYICVAYLHNISWVSDDFSIFDDEFLPACYRIANPSSYVSQLIGSKWDVRTSMTIGWKPSYTIESRLRLPRNCSADDQLINRKFEELYHTVSCLRLALDNPIGVSNTQIIPSQEVYGTWTNTFYHRSMSSLLLPRLDNRDNAVIGNEQGNDIRLTYDQLANSVQTTRISLHRFNLACSRSHPEDAIVDIVIALESLLLAGKPDTNLSYRFSIRAAAILRDLYDPTDAFKFAKLLYDIRSKIVHSAALLFKQKGKDLAGMSPAEFLSEAFRFCKQVILKYIHAEPAVPEDLVKQLDGLILDSLKPPSPSAESS